MPTISSVLSVRTADCQAVELTTLLDRAVELVRRYALTVENQKMIDEVMRILDGRGQGPIRSLYFYSGFGRGKSFLLLVLRALFEGWGRDLIMPKVSDGGVKARWSRVLQKRYFVIVLRGLNHASVEDAIRRSVVEAVTQYRRTYPDELAGVADPASAMTELQEIVEGWRRAQPHIYAAVDQCVRELSDGTTLDDLAPNLGIRGQGVVHRLVASAAERAGHPIMLHVRLVDPAKDLLAHYVEQFRACGYEGAVVLADEIGACLDDEARTMAEVQQLADFVNWFNESDNNSTFVATGQGVLESYGRKLQAQGPNFVGTLSGRMRREEFLAADMIDAIAGVLDLDESALAKDIPDANAIWDRRASQLREFYREANIPGWQTRNFPEYAKKTYPLHPMLITLLPALTDTQLGQHQRTLFTWLGESLPGNFQSLIDERNMVDREGQPAELCLPDLYEFMAPSMGAGEYGALVEGCRNAMEERRDGLSRSVLKTVALLSIAKSPFRASQRNIAVALNQPESAIQLVLETLVNRGYLFRRTDGVYQYHEQGALTIGTIEDSAARLHQEDWIVNGDIPRPVSATDLKGIIDRTRELDHQLRQLVGQGVPLPPLLPGDVESTEYRARYNVERPLTISALTPPQFLTEGASLRQKQPVEPVTRILCILWTDSNGPSADIAERMSIMAADLAQIGYCILLPKRPLPLSQPIRDLRVAEKLRTLQPLWEGQSSFKQWLASRLRGLLQAISELLVEPNFECYAPGRSGETIPRGHLSEYLCEVLEYRFFNFPGRIDLCQDLQNASVVAACSIIRDGRFSPGFKPQAISALRGILRPWGMVTVVEDLAQRATVVTAVEPDERHPKARLLLDCLDQTIPLQGGRLSEEQNTDLVRRLRHEFGLLRNHVPVVLTWYQKLRCQTLRVISRTGRLLHEEPFISWATNPEEYVLDIPVLRPDQLALKQFFLNELPAKMGGGTTEVTDWTRLTSLCHALAEEIIIPARSVGLLDPTSPQSSQTQVNSNVLSALPLFQSSSASEEAFLAWPEKLDLTPTTLMRLLLTDLQPALNLLRTEIQAIRLQRAARQSNSSNSGNHGGSSATNNGPQSVKSDGGSSGRGTTQTGGTGDTGGSTVQTVRDFEPMHLEDLLVRLQALRVQTFQAVKQVVDEWERGLINDRGRSG